MHAQDPVVHAPPVLLGFWHAPFEVFYNKVLRLWVGVPVRFLVAGVLVGTKTVWNCMGSFHSDRVVETGCNTHEQDESEYRVCDATGEDITCSNSYLFQFDVNDHREYLGVPF